MNNIDLINEINPKHKFRDPIYGYIWLTDAEMEIIKQPIFQRLRRIHQLALTKYVYPTAEHSRFTHSLGVLQSATNIFLDLYKFNKDAIDSIFDNNRDNIIKIFKILRYIALLHDVGHLPFSHAAEESFLENGKSHEDISKYIISETKTIRKVIENDCDNIQYVLPLLKGYPKSEYSYIKRFLSDEFDADRADYLLRDSYLCGVKYGLYDYSRYIGSFKLIENGNGEFDFGISSKNIHAIESFILARHYYNLQIPYHRTRVGYDIILRKFIKEKRDKFYSISGIESISDGKLEIDLENFIYFDDYSIFEEIKNSDKEEKNPLAKILMRGDRLHPVFDREATKTNNNEIESFFKKYIELLESEGFNKGTHFFEYQKTLPIHKITGKPDEESDKKYPVIDGDMNNIGDLTEYSPIFKNLSDNPIYLYRIYVFTPYLENAKKIYYNLLKKHK